MIHRQTHNIIKIRYTDKHTIWLKYDTQTNTQYDKNMIHRQTHNMIKIRYTDKHTKWDIFDANMSHNL